MGLFAGLVCALADRLKTKKGRLVTNSLFRQGVFVNALALCSSGATLNPTKRVLEHGVPKYANPRPDQVPSYYQYESSDRRYFSLVAAPEHAAPTSALLAQRLSCDNSTDAVATALSSMPFAEIADLTQQLGIPVVVKTDASVSPVKDARLAGMFESFVHGDAPAEDCPQVCKLPFTFSCSDKHGAQYRASSLGCHTQAFKKTGWSPRADEQALSALVDAGDVVVVELSEARSSCVAAGTLQFANQVHACKIIRILTGPSYWAERNPKFEAMLSEGKETRRCSGLDGVRAELLRIAKGGASVIFATNERATTLRHHGLDYDSLQSEIRNIVVVLVTPFNDVAEGEEVRGELGGYTMATPIAEFFSGVRAAPAKLPDQMGELCASMTVMSALASAHFHRLRTGEGQLVTLSLQSAGFWSVGFLLPLCYNESLWDLFRNVPGTEPLEEWDWMKDQFPLFSNFKTKDGAFVALTPVTAPKLIQHAKAMGLMASVMSKVLCSLAKAKLSGGDTLSAVFSAFAKTNPARRKFIEGKTLAEFQAFAKEKDVWWSPVMTPKELLQSKVVSDANAISGEGQDWSIHCPVQTNGDS